MLTLLALIPIAYTFPSGTAARFDVHVGFDGYLPLLGGKIGKVDVEMAVDVKGLAPDENGRQQASSEIVGFSLSLDGAKLPMLTVQSVQEFFPKTTISLSPLGKILKTDAPDKKLPFRLPGLDIKRFPDITYLPIEFPESGIEVGRPYEFKKRFGDSDVSYTVTPSAITDEIAVVDVKLAQTYEVLEDSGGNVIEDEADAVRKVKTKLVGSGKVTFDRKRGLASTVDIVAESHSKVVEIRSKAESERNLKTSLKVKVKPNG